MDIPFASILAVADRAMTDVRARFTNTNWETHRDVACKDVTDSSTSRIAGSDRIFLVSGLF